MVRGQERGFEPRALTDAHERRDERDQPSARNARAEGERLAQHRLQSILRAHVAVAHSREHGDRKVGGAHVAAGEATVRPLRWQRGFFKCSERTAQDYTYPHGCFLDAFLF